MSKPLNIIIVEASSVIYEGLTGILSKSGTPVHIFHTANLNDIEKYANNQKQSITIINPSFIQNNLKAFNILRSEYPENKWIAFIYALFDSQTISHFDAVINISDSPESIIATIKRVSSSENDPDIPNSTETLSDRETEVLQLLATGLSNKEIADRLNISINTAITHRKNISQKTGIKSISGLTIYAVAKKLINLENI